MKIGGLTLVEIMAVVIIIAVLATLSAPKFFDMVEKSRRAEAGQMLSRMYKGFQTLIIDEGLKFEGGVWKFYNTSDWLEFNPDESNILPNVPTGRSDRSWKALGFEMNPNYEQLTMEFSYDFLNNNDNSETGSPGRIGTGRPPGSNGITIGVAWYKTSNEKPWGQLFPVDFDRYLYVCMNNGTIVKSSHYQ